MSRNKMQYMVTKILPLDYFLFLACFTMVGFCYYYFVALPRKALEEASALQALELFVPAENVQADEVQLDVTEFEKKYRIVNRQNEIISNYLQDRIGYESVHEELQKMNLVTGESNETASVVPLKRPYIKSLLDSLGIADTYEESLLSSGLVYNQHETARWYKNERLPKSDDFRRTAVGTTQIILFGHMMACWKGKSLNYIGKIVSDLF